MCHQGGIHWFPRDELGNGIQRFSLGVTESTAGHEWHKRIIPGSCLTSWSHLILDPLPKRAPDYNFQGDSSEISPVIKIPEDHPPGNSFLLAISLYSRARVERETCETQSTNYVIKISYSALTFHSVVICGEIIQLATELTAFWTAFTGFSSYLYVVLNIF